MAAERERRDAQKLDQLRRRQEGAGGERQGQRLPGPAATVPRHDRGHGQRRGQRRGHRIARQQQHGPEQSQGGEGRRRRPAGQRQGRGDQGRRHGDPADQVVEVQVRQEEAAAGVQHSGRPGRLATEPPDPGQGVERERRQQQMEPEVGVEGPQERRHAVEQVVRVERHRVGVAQMRLAAGAVGVDQRQRSVAHGLGLHPLHLQVGVEQVAQVEGLGAADEWQDRCQQQEQGWRDVEQREAAVGLHPGEDIGWGLGRRSRPAGRGPAAAAGRVYPAVRAPPRAPGAGSAAPRNRRRGPPPRPR